jgi:D-sedoheptulose 7-phosphate isomerase
MDSDVSRLLRETADTLRTVSDSNYSLAVEQALNLLEAAFREGRTLLVFGNGGSSADAQHLCAELVGRFLLDRRPLPAIALTTNQALLTAWSNDCRFDDVFVRQLEGLGRPGDVAWGISTSGNSANVVNGLRRARELGLRTIGLTGSDGGRAAEFCDVVMAVPLRETPRIQEVHLVTFHAICGALEQRLFGQRSVS